MYRPERLGKLLVQLQPDALLTLNDDVLRGSPMTC